MGRLWVWTGVGCCLCAVTAYGIEALDGTYVIEANRLLESSYHHWPAHMAEKVWPDVDEFTTAWMVALVLHGYPPPPQTELLAMFGRLWGTWRIITRRWIGALCHYGEEGLLHSAARIANTAASHQREIPRMCLTVRDESLLFQMLSSLWYGLPRIGEIEAMDEGIRLPATAYESDLYAWATEQAALIRDERLGLIDRDNIAEELDALAKSQRRALASELGRLLMHLLKCKYQPSARTPSWQTSINGARDQLDDLVADNPSLNPEDFMAKAYRRAVRDAADETGMRKDTFPAECPWSIDEIRAEGWLPG